MSESAPLQAPCPHFGECGGCQFQDLSYEEQLSQKTTLLEEILQEFWSEAIPVLPSPVQWHYRNKVDPSFAPKQYETPPPKDFQRDTVLGFKKKGRWFWPLAIEQCEIGPDGFGDLLKAVRAWYEAAGLHAFSSKTGKGFLRCLLVRDGKRSGERMVVLITRPGDFEAEPFVEAVRNVYNPVSIYRGIFSGVADVAVAEELDLLWGKGEITETLHVGEGADQQVLDFRISPFSFFQTNPLATEKLYTLIRNWVRETGAKKLYDLYGGMGSIAFSCADLVDQVWSVENVAEASADGRHNGEVNGITNVEFHTEKVKNYLLYRERAGDFEQEAAVVLDPPRAGMHPKALKRLMALEPQHILYVSCNPKIFARELPSFLEKYKLKRVQAVDLFPHTRHVELVSVFEK